MSDVPTENQARQWAARLIARSEFSWDRIAEMAHPDGDVLSQEACNLVNEALTTAIVTVSWFEPGRTGTVMSMTYGPENR